MAPEIDALTARLSTMTCFRPMPAPPPNSLTGTTNTHGSPRHRSTSAPPSTPRNDTRDGKQLRRVKRLGGSSATSRLAHHSPLDSSQTDNSKMDVDAGGDRSRPGGDLSSPRDVLLKIAPPLKDDKAKTNADADLAPDRYRPRDKRDESKMDVGGSRNRRVARYRPRNVAYADRDGPGAAFPSLTETDVDAGPSERAGKESYRPDPAEQELREKQEQAARSARTAVRKGKEKDMADEIRSVGGEILCALDPKFQPEDFGFNLSVISKLGYKWICTNMQVAAVLNSSKGRWLKTKVSKMKKVLRALKDGSLKPVLLSVDDLDGLGESLAGTGIVGDEGEGNGEGSEVKNGEESMEREREERRVLQLNATKLGCR